MHPASESRVNFTYTSNQQSDIHLAACHQVECAVFGRECDLQTLLGDLAGRSVAGVYVSLKRADTLRGCCGMQGRSIALADAIADAAIRTACEDPRMAPITTMELPFLSLSVSILGPPQPVAARGDDRIQAVQVGRHGLRIRMSGKAGLLLPSVARDRDWNSRQFLDAICTKAGLPPGAWRSDLAMLETFEGIDFGGPFQVSELYRSLHQADQTDPCLLSDDELYRLARWVEFNLDAMVRRATPAYYTSEVSDRTVQGIVLRVSHDSIHLGASWLRLAIREGLPLQATLFQMTQHAATYIATEATRATGESVTANVAVMGRAVHHGDAELFDLAGVDVRNRSMFAIDGKRWSVSFDPNLPPEKLLQQTLAAQPFRFYSTQVYSARCNSTEPAFMVSMGPEPQSRMTTREPAVAGMFYPKDDNERKSLVDQLLSDRLLSGTEPLTPRSVEAAMVPHAGLHFSGKIAADVWRRIEIPQSVLIIGPKHTADGVDWAVAPHDVWKLSEDCALAGDVELANMIARSIPGMQLDAAAHVREHGIEVQLPFLYRLAPSTRVAAIAMSGATFNELERTADAMARMLLSLARPPLLVISSDMNHFADDAENRRRDRIALAALQRNDPRELLQRCQQENISMCGQVPAALVLLTLKAMGRSAHYQEIGYATSGDISGDRSRVVGYAGVLF